MGDAYGHAMLECEGCGSDNAVGVEFCTKCGRLLPDKKPAINLDAASARAAFDNLSDHDVFSGVFAASAKRQDGRPRSSGAATEPQVSNKRDPSTSHAGQPAFAHSPAADGPVSDTSRAQIMKTVARAATKGIVKSVVLSLAVLGPGFAMLMMGNTLPGMIWLFFGSFGLMAWTYRKPWRLGLISCLIPPAAAAACYVVQFVLFGDAAPPIVLILGAVALGIGVGFWRARTHEVKQIDGGFVAERTIGYLLVWVAAYGITQGMSLFTTSTYAVRGGLVTGAFSTAMLAVVSLVIWRNYKLLRAAAILLVFGMPMVAGDQARADTGTLEYMKQLAGNSGTPNVLKRALPPGLEVKARQFNTLPGNAQLIGARYEFVIEPPGTVDRSIGSETIFGRPKSGNPASFIQNLGLGNAERVSCGTGSSFIQSGDQGTTISLVAEAGDKVLIAKITESYNTPYRHGEAVLRSVALATCQLFSNPSSTAGAGSDRAPSPQPSNTRSAGITPSTRLCWQGISDNYIGPRPELSPDDPSCDYAGSCADVLSRPETGGSVDLPDKRSGGVSSWSIEPGICSQLGEVTQPVNIPPEDAVEAAIIIASVLIAAGVAVNVAQAIAIAIANAIQAGVQMSSEEIQQTIADALLNRSGADDTGDGQDPKPSDDDADINRPPNVSFSERVRPPGSDSGVNGATNDTQAPSPDGPDANSDTNSDIRGNAPPNVSFTDRVRPPTPIYDENNQPFETNDKGQYWGPDDKGDWRWLSKSEAQEASAALNAERSQRQSEQADHDRKTQENLARSRQKMRDQDDRTRRQEKAERDKSNWWHETGSEQEQDHEDWLREQQEAEQREEEERRAEEEQGDTKAEADRKRRDDLYETIWHTLSMLPENERYRGMLQELAGAQAAGDTEKLEALWNGVRGERQNQVDQHAERADVYNRQSTGIGMIEGAATRVREGSKNALRGGLALASGGTLSAAQALVVAAAAGGGLIAERGVEDGLSAEGGEVYFDDEKGKRGLARGARDAAGALVSGVPTNGNVAVAAGKTIFSATSNAAETYANTYEQTGDRGKARSQAGLTFASTAIQDAGNEYMDEKIRQTGQRGEAEKLENPQWSDWINEKTARDSQALEAGKKAGNLMASTASGIVVDGKDALTAARDAIRDAAQGEIDGRIGNAMGGMYTKDEPPASESLSPEATARRQSAIDRLQGERKSGGIRGVGTMPMGSSSTGDAGSTTEPLHSFNDDDSSKPPVGAKKKPGAPESEFPDPQAATPQNKASEPGDDPAPKRRRDILDADPDSLDPVLRKVRDHIEGEGDFPAARGDEDDGLVKVPKPEVSPLEAAREAARGAEQRARALIGRLRADPGNSKLRLDAELALDKARRTADSLEGVASSAGAKIGDESREGSQIAPDTKAGESRRELDAEAARHQSRTEELADALRVLGDYEPDLESGAARTTAPGTEAAIDDLLSDAADRGVAMKDDARPEDPFDPRATPAFEEDAPGQHGTGGSSNEEMVREEFVMGADGTVIAGTSNALDDIPPNESRVQINARTRKIEVVHGRDVLELPTAEKSRRAAALVAKHREKIDQAIAERSEELARRRAQQRPDE